MPYIVKEWGLSPPVLAGWRLPVSILPAFKALRLHVPMHSRGRHVSCAPLPAASSFVVSHLWGTV